MKHTPYDLKIMSKFSINVEGHRTALGLSQPQMAERLGISKNAYINYEKGVTEPKICVLVRIAEMFGITLDELVFGGTGLIDDKLKSRLNKLETLPDMEKKRIVNVIDALLLQYSTLKTAEELRDESE